MGFQLPTSTGELVFFLFGSSSGYSHVFPSSQTSRREKRNRNQGSKCHKTPLNLLRSTKRCIVVMQLRILLYTYAWYIYIHVHVYIYTWIHIYIYSYIHTNITAHVSTEGALPEICSISTQKWHAWKMLPLLEVSIAFVGRIPLGLTWSRVYLAYVSGSCGWIPAYDWRCEFDDGFLGRR